MEDRVPVTQWRRSGRAHLTLPGEPRSAYHTDRLKWKGRSVMKRIAIAISAVALGAAIAMASGEPRRATVLTQKGEIIEGVFLGGTDSEVVLEIAGQPLKMPISTIQYISFSGKITAGAPVTVGADPVDDAFAALGEMQSAVEVGILRPQYADKLQATLPRVVKVVKAPPPTLSADTVAALASALENYQTALDLEMWPLASGLCATAKEWAQYARQLREKDQPDHKETPDRREIKSSDTVTGRYGSGDATIPENIGKRGFTDSTVTTGAFSDVYVLRTSTSVGLVASATGGPGAVLITLTDESGTKRMGRAAGTLKKDVDKPGTYALWVSGSGPGKPGAYTLTLLLNQQRKW
jgi:hypothetical protein